MRVALLDETGVVLAASRDVRALQREHLAPGAATAPSGAAQWTRANVTRWDFVDLPDGVTVPQRPRDVVLYPALLDSAGSVEIKLVPPGLGAAERHRGGVRRLLLKGLPQQTALIRDRTLADRELVLAYHGIGSTELLIDGGYTAG